MHYWIWNNNYTEIKVEFQNKSGNESVSNIIQNGLALNWNYSLLEERLESITQYLTSTPIETGREVNVSLNETGFKLRFFLSDQHLFMRLYDFIDYYATKADYDECDQIVFDTTKYLEMVLYLSQHLIINKIRIFENGEYKYDPEFLSFMKAPVRNTISAFIGSTYHLKSPYQYLICLLNNIIENDGQIKSDYHYTDVNDLAKYLAAQLVENTENGVPLHFSMKDQLFELIIYPENLTLKPIGDLKKQALDSIEYVDVAYYTQIFMYVCKDLGIRDMETYFD